MLADNKVAFITPIQVAFMQAKIKALGVHPKARPAVAKRVSKALNHTKPLQVRAVDAKVSYRTAQKLRSEGVL